MRFTQHFTAQRLSLDPSGTNPIALKIEKEHALAIELRTNPDSEDIKCTIGAELDPPDSVRDAFDALTEGRLPTPPAADEFRPDYVAADGTLREHHIAPLHLMPESFRQFAGALSAEMSDAASAALGALRWRSRALGSQRVLSAQPVEWSLDREEWNMLPTSTGVTTIDIPRIEVGADTSQELQVLLDAGISEPLAHALLREGWSQRRENPSSALLIGMAALEIGVKEYVAACAPDAAWLAENAPTPPVVNMLTDYLPTLQPLAGGHAFPSLDDELIKVLRVGVNLRNALAHRGEQISSDRLDKTLRAVRNVLWTLDAARGYPWAAEYVTALDNDPAAGFRRI
jgi:hypothetical protein